MPEKISKPEQRRRERHLESLADQVTELALERKIIPDIQLARDAFREGIITAARNISLGSGQDEVTVLKTFLDSLRQASKEQIAATFKSLEDRMREGQK